MSNFLPISSSSASGSSGNGSLWRYDAGDGQPLVIRGEPLVDGKRTTEVLNAGASFSVAEEKVGEDGVLYLKLADGRGWVFDRKPGVGSMCERKVSEVSYWRYDAGDGQLLIVREIADLDAPRTNRSIQPGEVFQVSRELEGKDGVIFLKLADGGGWAFDHKPGVGTMCERHMDKDAFATPSPLWRYVAKDGKPIFVRKSPDIDAPRTEQAIEVGNLFCVSEEQRGADGVLYLQLADGSGWLFDTKPGVGMMCQRHEAPVTLHIYDVTSDPTALKWNGVLRALGTGAYHAGVEVYGVEWSFGANQEGEGGTGVFTCPPKGCEGHSYRESLFMGHSALTEDEARAMIGRLSKVWLAKDYDILRKNCCHYSDIMCQKLQVGGIPSWVRNLSGVGRVLDDRRRSFQEAIVDPALARGKIVRGAKPTDDTRFGDFSLGVMTAVAEQANGLIEGNKVMKDAKGKIMKNMDCSA